MENRETEHVVLADLLMPADDTWLRRKRQFSFSWAVTLMLVIGLVASCIQLAVRATDLSGGESENIYAAISRDSYSIVAAIIQDDPYWANPTENADLFHPYGRDRLTPLELAVAEGHNSIAHLLISRGALHTVASPHGARLLIVASKNHNLPIAAWLLERRVDPNAQYEYGATALHIAAEFGDKELASLLLKHRASPNLHSRGGQTPTHVAATQLKRFKTNYPAYFDRNGVLELLLTHGADPNIKDSRGKTPLDYAIQSGDAEAQALLSQHGGKWPEPAERQAE